MPFADGDPADCPVERTLARLSGRWRLLVLFRLGRGPVRWGALRRSLAPVTPRVLTATLRALEADGLVWRASIGPFWDANETWLVLAVGLLLVAFPAAHGLILSTLYLPVFVLLVGLILRGVSFEFRVKARARHREAWNRAFFAGSLMATLAQGWMLGLYIMGLERTWQTYAFAALCALCLTLGYAFIGAAWLILKSQDNLQREAIRWAKSCIFGLAGGIAAVSLASPLVSPRIWEKWFSYPEFLWLAPCRCRASQSSPCSGARSPTCRRRMTAGPGRPSPPRSASSPWPSRGWPTASTPMSCPNGSRSGRRPRPPRRWGSS